MKDKNLQAYRQQMDSVKAPEALSRDVLQKMLEKNDRLARGGEPEEDPQPGRAEAEAPPRKTVRFTRWALPVAAAFVLFVGLGGFFLWQNQVPVASFSLEDLPPADTTARAPLDGAAVPEGAPATMALPYESLAPGFTLESLTWSRVNYAGTEHEALVAEARYKKGGETLTLTLSMAGTPLTETLQAGTPETLAGIPVYFGRDTGQAGYFACWARGDVTCLLNGAGLGKNAFVGATEEILNTLSAYEE